MNAIKQILKWTLICLLAFTSFNLFISGDYQVERSTTINAPAYVVYGEVTDLQTWKDWAVWWKKDTTIVTEYSGARYAANSAMTWTGVDGNGSLKVTSVSFADSITTEIIFDGMSTAYGSWYFESLAGGGTKVSWGMKGEMPFFMHFLTLFFDDMIGADFEAGLAGLKEKCESIPSRSSEVTIVDVPEQNYLFISTQCSMNNIAEAMGAIYGELFAYIGQQQLTPVAMPFARWISFPEEGGDEEFVTFEAGILITTNHIGNDRVKGNSLSARKTLQATHYGSYELSENTHKVITAYVAENGLKVSGIPFEFYPNDPTTVAPEDVETLIIYDLVE